MATRSCCSTPRTAVAGGRSATSAPAPCRSTKRSSASATIHTSWNCARLTIEPRQRIDTQSEGRSLETTGKLRDAGYSSSFDKLIQIAQDAWSRSPGEKAAIARYRYVQDRLSGELTYEMMRQWEPDALRRSINYLLESTKPKRGDSVVGFLPTGG